MSESRLDLALFWDYYIGKKERGETKMFQIPAAQKGFQEKAKQIKAQQEADAAKCEADMQAKLAEWAAMSEDERKAAEKKMRDKFVAACMADPGMLH
jgi:hypothetical protein